MTTLVTGGGGYLGFHIVEQLQGRGEEVRVLCRGEYPRLRAFGVSCHRGDVRDAESVDEAVAGCETVFHVAAVPGIWGPWKHFYEINTLGTLNVLEACKQHGVSRLIYTSSPSVVFDGTSHLDADESAPYPEKYLCHYPKTKALAEQAVLKANDPNGLLTCALRPHLIWGPRDNHLIPRLIRRAKTGRLRRVGDGRNLISMSYVENTTAAHLQAADALKPGSPVAGEAYFINEPEPVNLWQWIDELLSRAGLPPLKKRISAKAAYRVGAVLEGIYKTLRISSEPPMTRFLALQLRQSHTYSIAKARRDFGYEPNISIEAGMRKIEPELKRFAS
jgi:2-alkyl-3-oxoalkanoate reductase